MRWDCETTGRWLLRRRRRDQLELIPETGRLAVGVLALQIPELIHAINKSIDVLSELIWVVIEGFGEILDRMQPTPTRGQELISADT